jgi:large subunit ribosomal protein L3
MSIGLLGKKVGMTRVYDEKGVVTPVTVIHAGGNTLLQIKSAAREGYDAVQVGYGDQKEHRLSKPLAGHFKKAGAAPKRFIREFRVPAGQTIDGLDLSLARFKPGEFVDIIGQSKGKGFQGVMRKHGAHGQPAAHGSKMHRRTGAIGNRSTPGRVWKNMSMPGHMGDKRSTTQNLRIIQVREEDGVLLVRGAIPGANGTFVVVRPSKKKKPAAAA